MGPQELKQKLFAEKRKAYAKRWFTKYNYYQKKKEDKEISKRGRSSSGIGEERIKQMEMAKSMVKRARGRAKNKDVLTLGIGLPKEFNPCFKKRGRKGKYTL